MSKEDSHRITDPSIFKDREVVVTEKMDGENTSMYCDHIHARSLDSRHHPSRDWVKGFHGSIKHFIPTGWRVCGENMYAEHSIFYDSLRAYFLGFSIWTDENICLSWSETCYYFSEWGIRPPPVLWTGIFDLKQIEDMWATYDESQHEGYVIRDIGRFDYSDFSTSVAKYVRPNHVQTDQHWTKKAVVPNKLKT